MLQVDAKPRDLNKMESCMYTFPHQLFATIVSNNTISKELF